MILTTKGRYAVAAVIDLVQDESKQPVALASIASRQDISLSYLEQIFAKLKKHGLVSAIKGPGGGYLLAKDKSQITVADIINAINEPIKITKCGGKMGCKKNNQKCQSHDLWHGLETMIHQYLKSVSLIDFCKKNATNIF